MCTECDLVNVHQHFIRYRVKNLKYYLKGLCPLILLELVNFYMVQC